MYSFKCFVAQESEISFIRPKSRYGQSNYFSGGSDEESIPCLFHLLVVASILWLVATFLEFSKPAASNSLLSKYCYLWMCQISLYLSLVRNFVTAFSPHLNNPGQWHYLKILKLSTNTPNLTFSLSAIQGNTDMFQGIGHGSLGKQDVQKHSYLYLLDAVNNYYPLSFDNQKCLWILQTSPLV